MSATVTQSISTKSFAREVFAPRRAARLVGMTTAMLLLASVGYAEPPRSGELKMRSAPTLSATLATPARPNRAAPVLSLAKLALAPVTEAAPDPAEIDRAAKAAAEVLNVCYAIARRTDPSFDAKEITVQATVQDDATLLLRTESELGDGYFARCVERKLGAWVTVGELTSAEFPKDASTRVITLGASNEQA